MTSLNPRHLAETSVTEAGLVTVVMPNRNHAHYLPRALDAMLAQTWDRLEIIVVDDASTDDSRDVIAAYQKRDQRVRLVALKDHHGVSRAVNAALEVARGEFLYTAAADDFVEPIFLARCIEEMNKHPEAGMTFSDPTEFYDQGSHKVMYPLCLSERPTYFSAAALVDLLSRNYFHISANTGLYRTSLFREAGGYQPQLYWLSDWFVTLVVTLRHGVCFMPEQLTYVTIRSDSYSAQNLLEGKAQRALLEQVLKLLADPAYADVAARMRQAALIPEYHFRTLFWLLANAEGRNLITPKLIARILSRATWSYLRPLFPTQWRRHMRQMKSKLSRVG